MGKWTIKLLRKLEPEQRLVVAAWLFWISILLGAYCTVFVARTPFERILMAISWGAITITCVDIIVSSDVREELGNGNGS